MNRPYSTLYRFALIHQSEGIRQERGSLYLENYPESSVPPRPARVALFLQKLGNGRVHSLPEFGDHQFIGGRLPRPNFFTPWCFLGLFLPLVAFGLPE